MKLREVRGIVVLTVKRGANVYVTWLAKPNFMNRLSDKELPPTGINLELFDNDPNQSPIVASIDAECVALCVCLSCIASPI